MQSSVYSLSEGEAKIWEQGRQDPNIFFGYFFRRPGQPIGFQLDSKFTDEGKWQMDMCLASQTFIVVIGGVSTGKTIGIGLSAFAHGSVTEDFKFLNVAKESWQSQLMYSAILEFAKGCPAEKLILSSPKRPYPMIEIAFNVRGHYWHSTLEFMSIGSDRDATNIFSWRGDWLNIDEAGRLDNLTEIVGNLSTRGTGNTPTGREYMSRLSLISNPWDNPELWQMFDIAAADPTDSLAINVETKDNLNTTEKQVKKILKLVPKEDYERFLTGKRPEGRGNYFTKDTVAGCESELLSMSYLHGRENATPEEEPYWTIQSAPHLGVWNMKTPKKEGRTYFLLGDPGTGAAPSRNAPVLMVFDVTEVPSSPAALVALWWGNGGGSITPWVSEMMSLIEYYKPTFAGVDSTGTQKNTAEILTMEYIVGKKLSIDYLTGLDFSGPKKYSYLIALRLSLESRGIIWAHVISAIGSQLRNYDPTLDKSAASKLPQDLVSTLAMAAFAIRANYGIFDQKPDGSSDTASGTDVTLRRHSRQDDAETRRSFRESRERTEGPRPR
jgi:hypothetical protein